MHKKQNFLYLVCITLKSRSKLILKITHGLSMHDLFPYANQVSIGHI
jgi:hypothetical protein